MDDITENKYKSSVLKLCALAQGDSSSSRAAAQVLLSAYNGGKWQLDISDLCALDYENFDHAIMVMKGRKILCMEPHYIIDNGSEIFKKLWSKWIRYIVYNRWKYDCTVCDGQGELYSEDDCQYTKCRRCNGSGLIEPVEIN